MPHQVIRRSVAAPALVLGVLAIFGIAGILSQQSAAADPPDPTPGASQPVREQNLDVSGLIRVHEQGTADVNVTNTPLDVQGSVDVDNFPTSFEVSNFPDVQDVSVVGGALSDVRLASVSHVEQFSLNAPPGQEDLEVFLNVVDATSVVISKVDEEVFIQLATPLPGGLFTVMHDFDGDTNWLHLNFVHPVPLSAARIICENESELCSVHFAVFGFSAD